MKNNLNCFNEFWIKLGKEPIQKYEDLRAILKAGTLSKLELCSLLWECENYGIYTGGISVWDFIDRVK